ncbi:MAG: hypothetical protein KR126chlam5_00018 [Candidatus Anoxychlamydiales bacterium]|nr:hypothetical protein [Candidatus Anoxychlamydiales bacterium]
MSSISTSRNPTITTFCFTNEHLSHPEYFAIDSKRESDDKPSINFSMLEHKPVCAILKTSFEVDDTVAKCTKCFNAFLARNLYRYFISTNSKRINPEIRFMTASCPNCRSILKGEDLIITPIEKLKIQIDLLNDKIADFEEQQTRRKEEIDRYAIREEQSLGPFLNLKAEPDEEEGSEASSAVADLKNSSVSSIASYKSSRESEIAELQKAIDNSKKRIEQLDTLIATESEKSGRAEDSSKVRELEDKIVALQSALNFERTKNAKDILIPDNSNLQDSTAVISVLALAIFFLSYILLQKTTFFCPIPQH